MATAVVAEDTKAQKATKKSLADASSLSPREALADTQSQIKSDKKTIGKVKVDELQSDHRWQRHVSNRAKGIGENWSDSLAQTIVVSKRKNGDMVVIDGQHRAAGARIAGIPELIAEIHEGLTPRDEAELYDRLNTTRASISALDRFRARVFYKDPTAMAIKESVESRGGKIRESLWRGSGQQSEIAAIWALERVYRAGGQAALDWELDVLKDSFGDLTADTVSLLNVSGLLRLWEKHGDYIDTGHLVKQLRNVGWITLRHQAHAHRQLWGGTGTMNGYRALVEIYNKHVDSKKKLQP